MRKDGSIIRYFHRPYYSRYLVISATWKSNFMLPHPLDNFVEVPTLVNNIPSALVATFPVMDGNVCLASKDLSEKFNTVVCRVLEVSQHPLPLTEK